MPLELSSTAGRSPSGRFAIAVASVAVGSTRLSRRSRRYASVQRWSPMFAPARLMTASTPSRAVGSRCPEAGVHRISSGPAGARRTSRTMSCPSPPSRSRSRVPRKPDAPAIRIRISLSSRTWAPADAVRGPARSREAGMSVGDGNLWRVRTTRSGASPVMIGRDRELRAADSGSRRPGVPSVAIVAGEPGIGKTRLVQELLATLGRRHGGAGRAGRAGLARPARTRCCWTPSTAATTSTPSSWPRSPTRPAARSSGCTPALAMVGELVGDRPAVLVFEDLHWADSESAALFERIADQPGPRLLVGTYRPDEVTSRAPGRRAAGPAGAAARGDPRRGWSGFAEADTAALLAARHRPAGAVPRRGRAAPAHRRQPVLPRGAAARPRAPTTWTTLLRAAAAVEPRRGAAPPGRRPRPDEASGSSRRPRCSATGCRSTCSPRSPAPSEDELIAALRELVDRGVLVETGEDEFSFRHALVREAIAGQLLGRQRRRLHEAALEALLADRRRRRPGDGRPPRPGAPAATTTWSRAARRGAALYLSIGSAYQALQLAEMGLDEAGDDAELLAGAARARLAGRAARRRGRLRPALARPAPHRHRPGRRALPADPAGLGGRRDRARWRRSPHEVERLIDRAAARRRPGARR